MKCETPVTIQDSTISHLSSEMCVSSGRLDSVKELHYYKAPMPTLKVCIDLP
jgi:hypothetical protein